MAYTESMTWTSRGTCCTLRQARPRILAQGEGREKTAKDPFLPIPENLIEGNVVLARGCMISFLRIVRARHGHFLRMCEKIATLAGFRVRTAPLAQGISPPCSTRKMGSA